MGIEIVGIEIGEAVAVPSHLCSLFKFSCYFFLSAQNHKFDSLLFSQSKGPYAKCVIEML